jgi:protein-tyrosine phosphatase
MFDEITHFFFSEEPPPKLEVDIHSHLIPGIDDGAKTMEDSIRMIREFERLGYKKLITTPHTMSHRYPNTKTTILEGLAKVKTALEKEGIAMEIEAASEYYLDETIVDLIGRRELLTFGDNFLLFEMSYVTPILSLQEIIFEMKVAGYTPVLAHPERYVYLHGHFERYEALKEQGVLLQLNINSLGGFYDKEIQQTAIGLADAGLVDFVGSDAHKMRYLEALERTRKEEAYRRLFERNTLLNAMLASSG